MTHILIVEARFYEHIADLLMEGAVEALQKAGVSYDSIAVPGVFEIPAAIRFALNAERYDGFVALGCVIRGETTHYDYVCNESASGLTELAVHYQAAVGYGILTTENEEQALVRADKTKKNKGRDAVLACLRMVELKKQYGLV